ncbi:TIGR00289 family protein, partial [archaeon]|nr:TIGR00289 family protein [archaeon]
MKVAALVSGGKDSILALHKASEKHEVACLVTAVSSNPDSYMFHTDAVDLVKLQAE